MSTAALGELHHRHTPGTARAALAYPRFRILFVGSVLSSLAWSAGSLIAFRAVQGVAGGVLVPLMSTLVVQATGGDNLGRVMSVVSLPAVLGPILGPVVGGLILQHLHWSWMFWVNVPFCIAGIVLAALVNGITSAVAKQVAEWIGLGGQAWIVSSVGLLAAFLANSLLVALMLRVLSGVDLPWPGLRNGALFGGVAMTFLQTFGTRLIAGTTGNKLFASIALVVGLLAFLNFVSRAMLLAAAWAANDIDALGDAQLAVSAGEATKLVEGPPTRAEAAAEWTSRSPSALPLDPAARLAAGLPTFDQRAADRVSVASGAVLGAAATAATAGVLRAASSLRRRTR